jgi:hypothetical protein
MKRPDTLTLVLGLLVCLVAALGLWVAFGAPSGRALQIAVPLSFVAIGAVGLAFARSKNT